MKPAHLRYLVVALALGSASAQSKQGIDDADIWAATHYSDALTLLFPVPTYEDARTNAMKWFISVTASPDGARLFDPERQYILIRSDTGEVKLRERTIVGGRLGEQLASGSRKNPSLNVAQAIQDIRTEDVTIADLQCPQLRRLAKELEHLEMHVIPRDVLIIHATGYHVSVRTSIGDLRPFIVISDDEDPFSRWIDRLESTAKQCKKPAA